MGKIINGSDIKLIIIGMDPQSSPFLRSRGLELDAIFIDEATDLLSIADQISDHLERKVSIQEVGEMIGRLKDPTEISSRSLLDFNLEIKELQATRRDFSDLNDYDPPKNYLYNTPPRQKKDRNRPDKITLARRRKRKR